MHRWRDGAAERRLCRPGCRRRPAFPARVRPRRRGCAATRRGRRRTAAGDGRRRTAPRAQSHRSTTAPSRLPHPARRDRSATSARQDALQERPSSSSCSRVDHRMASLAARAPHLRCGPGHLLRRALRPRGHPPVSGERAARPARRARARRGRWRITTSCSAACRRSRRSPGARRDGLRAAAGARRAPAAGVRRHAQLASAAARHARARCTLPACGARSGSSPPRSTRYSSCQQYRENVAAARTELRAQALADIDVTFVDSWFAHPGFVAANAAHVADARARLPAAVAAGRAADLHRAQHSDRDGRPVAVSRAAGRIGEAGRRSRGHCRTTRWYTRAAAAGPRIPGSDPTSATTCARRARRAGGRRAVPHRLRVRPHRGAVRPRPRGGGGLPRDWPGR